MKKLISIMVIWFIAAFALSITTPPPSANSLTRFLIVVGPIVFLSFLLLLLKNFQRVMQKIPLRTLLILHVIRLPVGALFIILAGQKLLPYDFSRPAGIGDMLAGIIAMLLVIFYRRSNIPIALLVIWNIIGILDFVNVQRTVAMLAKDGRGAEFPAMQGPPLALVPYFGVPVLFFIHIYIFVRLIKKDRSQFVQTK